MLNSVPCSDCGNDVPLSSDRCPHCARPGLYPNVRAADQTDELRELDRRYAKAVKDAHDQGFGACVQKFESAVKDSSTAVIARSLHEVQRLAGSVRQLYATYYQQLEAGIKLPEGTAWDPLRGVAEEALFPTIKKEVRYAALSLNRLGMANYGECFLVCKESMIAHRASAFDENCVLFMKQHKVKMFQADKLPKGYRASWSNRFKVCIAKLADRVTTATRTTDFPTLLQTQGRTPEDDRFVEIHIWGPMTILTFEAVAVTRRNRASSRAILQALRETLDKLGVGFSIIP